MIVAIDVDYRGNNASVAGVLFNDWQAESPHDILYCRKKDIHEYISGQFYKRELPCLLKLLDKHRLNPECVVIDGFVYLDGHQKAGLGKYLYDALDQSAPIIGVAKNSFHQISTNHRIFRGNSQKPLYITTAGYDLESAKEQIVSMRGDFRIPALLKLADQACRNQELTADSDSKR